MITAIDDVVRNPSQAERLDRLEEKRDESSERLNLRIDELTRRFEASMSRPLEVDNIRFTPKVVVAIVVAVVSVVVGMYAANYGVRTDMQALKTLIESQKNTSDLNQRLVDQQTKTLTDKVDEQGRGLKLLDINLQKLQETVLRQGGTK